MKQKKFEAIVSGFQNASGDNGVGEVRDTDGVVIASIGMDGDLALEDDDGDWDKALAPYTRCVSAVKGDDGYMVLTLA